MRVRVPQFTQADTPNSYKKLYSPERLQKKNQKLESLIVSAVCVDPIYHRWFFDLRFLVLIVVLCYFKSLVIFLYAI